jgi:hypothetical protein
LHELVAVVGGFSQNVEAGDTLQVARTVIERRGPMAAPGTNWAGRAIHAKTYGNKRERGQHSYDFDLEAVLFRHRYQLAICCVQSWHAIWNARRIGY